MGVRKRGETKRREERMKLLLGGRGGREEMGVGDSKGIKTERREGGRRGRRGRRRERRRGRRRGGELSEETRGGVSGGGKDFFSFLFLKGRME